MTSKTIKYCMNGLYAIYDNSDRGMSIEGRSTSALNRVLSNPTATKKDKVAALLQRLQDHSDYGNDESREGHYSDNTKNKFWGNLKFSLCERGNATVLSGRNGDTLLSLIKQNCQLCDYVSDDILKIVYKLMTRRLMVEVSSQIRELTGEQKEKQQKLFDDCVTIINNNTANIRTYRRLTDRGGTQTMSPMGVKLGYQTHRGISHIKSGDNAEQDQMKYGFEGEGAMSENDFQNCCDELSRTPFEGGYLLDERNWIMPTQDCSLPRDTGVEGVFAPFTMQKGLKYGTAVEAILKKHNFRTECPSREGGIHCHLDANKFKYVSNLKDFHNTVFDMEHKEEFYGRQGNRFCSGNKFNTGSVAPKGIELSGQFTKDGKQLGYLELIFNISKNTRYSLVNYQNMSYDYDTGLITSGTVELRGGYANTKPSIVAQQIKNQILAKVGL